ncbi:uncharacterized protein EI97DRAFT_468001 [Westerdykella ornata]|uniref:2'-phosphotransferase n=1 Tax=Westerdykella ornata TaxID=318751 RepID=A0A6A6JKL6_WESOR|nr:uncharacterized protein EI97DRAFT_468001 [Westerdykella ornata]KAF2275429.1 hypothetical protein EI97DRAFT_468001 [Westerdykella ornata]
MSGRRGGGDRGGGRNPRDMPREQQVSRKVSWLLRHGAEQEGLKLGKGGWVNVADALNTPSLRRLNLSFAELKTIVETNDKQRFSLIPASSLSTSSTNNNHPSSSQDSNPNAPEEPSSTTAPEIPSRPPIDPSNPSAYLIRANQGHSLKLDHEGLLTPITEAAANIPRLCVHGTTEAAWPLILKGGGLRKMSRNHIHCAAGLPRGFKRLEDDDAGGSGGAGGGPDGGGAAPPVISGMRLSSSIIIYIDIRAAMAEGIRFFLSDNGVVLTEGDENGLLPCRFFERVECRKKGRERVLMRDGKVPEGVEVDVEAWEREVGKLGGKGKGGRGGRGGGKRGGRGGGRAKGGDGNGESVGLEQVGGE